jgi:hypothetical protein
MTDFTFSASITRDRMVEALLDKPEQLAYVLIELGKQLPGTWALDDLFSHLQGDGDMPDVAAFYRQLADKLMDTRPHE